MIRRCFSYDTRVEIPECMDGLTVTEAAPYAFSAHLDERMFTRELESGRLYIYIPNALCTGELANQCQGSFAGAGECMTEGRTVTGAGECMTEGRTVTGAGEYVTEGSTVAEAGECMTEGSTVAAAGEDGRALLAKLPPVLCGERLEEVYLPASLQSVGRYCFYNCAKLQKLEFDRVPGDWGTGVFTGCHKVKELVVFEEPDKKTSLKEVLDELPEAMTVVFMAQTLSGEGCGVQEAWHQESSGQETVARLVFPEYYEEGVENTPARILETHVHGSGILYRNCFHGGIFDFRQYDSLFPYAVAREPDPVTAQLAVSRLRFPYMLDEKFEEQYRAYVREHAKELAAYFLRVRDTQGLRWLLHLDEQMVDRVTDFVTAEAARQNYPEALGSLMEFRHEKERTRRKRREL